ncbi:MAG TPA: GTPase [Gammaproteobacteria bacterium]
MPGETLTRAWRVIRDVVLSPAPDAAGGPDVAALARERAPVVWLLGKVQSGKTSIVHAITGHPDAEIGRGYRPCTRTARVFDFPPDVPVIRFLDSSGLGEAGYDPTEDLAKLEQRAHVVLAVARAMDTRQDEILRVLRDVRARHPDWAVVLAQTWLHEGYPDGADHPPYEALATAPGLDDLRRSLARQAADFAALPGTGAVHAVPIDFTRTEEGYRDPRYGLDALLDALERAGTAGMDVILRSVAAAGSRSLAERARPHVLGYALAAAAADAVPMVGVVTVPTIQGKMLHSIGRIYGIGWNRATLRSFAASLGTGTAVGLGVRFGARQLAKLIPGYGQTVGAAAASTASFTITYALGRAACEYLGAGRRGGAADDVAQVYRESLQEALDMVRMRRSAPTAPGTEGSGE